MNFRLQAAESDFAQRCESELEELRKQQSERVQRALQQHEEKEQKLVVANQKREKEAEDNLLRVKRENKILGQFREMVQDKLNKPRKGPNNKPE